MLLDVARLAAVRMKQRRLWPSQRVSDDPAVQFAWGLLQGTVIGIAIVVGIAIVALVT